MSSRRCFLKFLLVAIYTFGQISRSYSKQNKFNSPKDMHRVKVYGNLSYTYVDEIRSSVLTASSFVQPLNYCSFFNNRAPSPQANLKNCTWYKENSCCLQAEIESTFSKVKPLIGSSKKCQLYLNSLMCYICAPNQFKFYGQERLTVCVEFCDKMYDACGNAILKGSKINEIYSNGEQFCQGRRYTIGYLKKDNCFNYDAESLEVSSSFSLYSNKSPIFPLFIILKFFIWSNFEC